MRRGLRRRNARRSSKRSSGCARSTATLTPQSRRCETPAKPINCKCSGLRSESFCCATRWRGSKTNSRRTLSPEAPSPQTEKAARRRPFCILAVALGREAGLGGLAIAEEAEASEAEDHHSPSARLWDRAGRALGCELQSFDLTAHVGGAERVGHDGERVSEPAKRKRRANSNGRSEARGAL